MFATNIFENKVTFLGTEISNFSVFLEGQNSSHKGGHGQFLKDRKSKGDFLFERMILQGDSHKGPKNLENRVINRNGLKH